MMTVMVTMLIGGIRMYIIQDRIRGDSADFYRLPSQSNGLSLGRSFYYSSFGSLGGTFTRNGE